MKIEGIAEVMEQVEDVKKTINTTTNAATKVSRANTAVTIIDRLLENGYFSKEEACEAYAEVAEMIGFHAKAFK